ncbi:type II secretion system F family protein [Pelagicoccus sp. SDUM812002]|uniref:type II secretion system F family protein n=1 Tax=Pelagicoccus sp. SDUM812002 TaxID=3041266 RepID=UPI00280E2949|nr:type II secretion system F family protein [Pelagicoccus sp. SDUM812002]MDQ8187337.1 type II secretion system F family protein [Pelagicoccus sp. SDUM812002]
MPIFKYNARDAAGLSTRGEMDAASRKLVVRKLSAQGLRPISVKESGASAAGGSKSGDGFGLSSLTRSARAGKLDSNVTLPFLTTLKELLACGVQAGDALQLMSSRLNDPSQKRLANVLWDDVRQGRSLSEACRKQTEVFDDSMVSLIEAGEATGNLNNVLGRLVANLEETKVIKNKLSTAMAYPSFLMVVAFGLVLLFLFFLLPQIEGLLASLGGDLPMSTKLLIGLADFALSYGWIVIIATVFGVTAILSWRKTKPGRVRFDEIILGLPVLGSFLRDVQVLRLVQVLSLLLENGITMVQSLQMSERSLTNHAMRQRFVDARGKVTEGTSLSNAFKGTGYLDGMALDIFTVGENTGNVVPGLKQLSRQYSERVDRAIKSFIGVVSIGVLIFVFLFVGLVALGIISAVFQLSGSLSG